MALYVFFFSIPIPHFHHAWHIVYHYEECSRFNCYLLDYDASQVYHLLSFDSLYRLPQANKPGLIVDPHGVCPSPVQGPPADLIRLLDILEKVHQLKCHSADEHLH
jgi:hypothetical protein